jgi:shikimate 5-dehydrogenase
VAAQLRRLHAAPRQFPPSIHGTPVRPWQRNLLTDVSATIEQASILLTRAPFVAAREVITVAAADIVVNATPIGMQGEAPPFDPDLLTAEQFVYDTVYYPSPTPLLTAATAMGIPSAGGLGMLVHQAAVAFTLWTGEPAPLAVMSAAASADMTS